MVKENEVKSYKWVSLKENPPKNAVLYVLDPKTRDVELFITDKFGNPQLVKTYVEISNYVKVGASNAIIVENNQLFVKKYKSGDEFINIEESPNKYEITLNEGKVELRENKQNSLTPDGTGNKYPTVDAVNEGLDSLKEEILTNVSGDKHFTYEQVNPNSIWEISHNLNKRVSVTVVDTANTVVMGQITINNGNYVRVEFNFPFSGYAYIN